jgi:pSer/pThr/pTyr-binding forkhead associated (FHA) protein
LQYSISSHHKRTTIALMIVNLTSPQQHEAIADHSSILHEGFALDELPLTIGRDPEADIRLDDRWVSRRNTEIAEIDGALVVRDLGSTNGTLLNGEPIAVSPIFPGDRLTVGMTTLVLASNGGHLKSNDAGATLALGQAAIEYRGGEEVLE